MPCLWERRIQPLLMKCEECSEVGDPFHRSDWSPVSDRQATIPLLECGICGHHQHLR